MDIPEGAQYTTTDYQQPYIKRVNGIVSVWQWLTCKWQEYPANMFSEQDFNRLVSLEYIKPIKGNPV